MYRIKKLEKYINIIDRKYKIFKREYLIILFFFIFFMAIVGKTFSYTVMNNNFYSDLADRQQIGKVILPVNRGAIYSSGDSESVLGTSVNLYDLAIDPQIEGNKSKLSSYLTDTIFNQVCYLKSFDDCKDGVLRFVREIEIENFPNGTLEIKKILGDYINTKINQEKVTSVFIDRELDNEQIDKIINLGFTGLYPSGNYLYVNPEEISDTEIISSTLSEIIGTNKEELKKLIRKRDLRYIPIYNRLSIGVSEDIKKFIDEEKLALKSGLINKSESISGFMILTPNPNRYYPEGTVGSQIIGFVDNSGNGNYGLESHFNDILKGNNGQIVSRKDIQGRVIDPIDLNQTDASGEGVKIFSTIDKNIQRKAEQLIEEGVKKYRANKGSIIVMEPKTGRVLTMANYPRFDLNNYSDIYELEKIKPNQFENPETDLVGYPIFIEDSENGEKYIYDNEEIFLRKAEREELGDFALVKYRYKNWYGPGVYRNDVISSLYEPGSIMKAITVAIGIDAGEISRFSLYNDEGFVNIDNFRIENVSDKCLGYKSFANALNFSCNVGMIRIVQRLGKVLVYNYFKDFGFDDKTGISLSGEAFSQIRPYEKWSTAQLLTSSFGLGISVTQLHMASAYSVLANGGVYITPRVIDKIELQNGNTINYSSEQQRRVIKESTSEILTSMLVEGNEIGAAANGNVPGFSLAGKTGTAEIPYRGKYESGPGFTNASYAGYGPAEDPKFVIVVKLERPRTNQYGGATSAFIFKDMAEYLFDYLAIPKKDID